MEREKVEGEMEGNGEQGMKTNNREGSGNWITYKVEIIFRGD